jgi:formate-dependent nitrite reductase cytochrome c552 subunit
MKILFFQRFVSLVLAALCITMVGCKEYAEHGGVTSQIKAATTPIHDAEGIDSVSPLTQKAVLVKEGYQGGMFWTEARKNEIERFKCSRCHNNKEVRITKAAEMAHGDIVMTHGGVNRPLTCFTCHKKDERDFLLTEKGSKIDLDHSYKMCGQCHFRQKKDWIGGAHGKRISYWAGKRVVRNCTSCHNPHSPRFSKRWPATYSPPLSK